MTIDHLAASGLPRSGPLRLPTLEHTRSAILDTPVRTQVPSTGPFRLPGAGTFDAVVYTAPVMDVFATRSEGARGRHLDLRA